MVQATFKKTSLLEAPILKLVLSATSYRHDATDDDIEIKLGSIVKKGRTLPLPNLTWCRLSWNMPVNASTLAHFWCNGRTYLYPHYHLDEVWVIAKV